MTVNLTGTDAYGNSVSISTTTNGSGAYTFAGMPFSNSAGYTVTPVVPSGYTAGIATAGKVNDAVRRYRQLESRVRRRREDADLVADERHRLQLRHGEAPQPLG